MLNQLKHLMKRLSAERNSGWIACLDFGTSYSKMAMVLSEAREELRPGDIRPLPLCDEPGSRSPFLLPSIVFVEEGALLFGVSAQNAAILKSERGRRGLDAPKQYLSTQDFEDLNGALAADVDPTGRYTPRMLISLYLAYLLLSAEQGARKFGLPWPPRLRIARPAWNEDRAAEGEARLKEMVREAFYLADLLEDELLRQDGLPHETALRALAALASADLSKTAWDAQVFALSREGGASVLEATAVAAGVIRRGGRRVVVVADIGGGTSDFAAFMTGLPGRNVVAELVQSAGVLRQAGDHIDMLLRKFILEKAGYLSDDPAARGAVNRIRVRQRDLKETLFTTGRISVELVDGFVEVIAAEFLEFAPVKQFATNLREKFSYSLDTAIAAARDYLPGSKLPVEIMATGGGCTLPMVRALIDDPQRNWRFVSADPDIAEIAGDEDLRRLAPQLAVAIGGAVRDLPVQTAPVRMH